MISEIVRTINLIPDAISRQVFYRESARLMDMPEESLLTEAQRLQLKKKGEDEKAARRESSQAAFEAGGTTQPTQEEDGGPALGDLLEDRPNTLAEQIEALERESLWVLLQWHEHEASPGSPLPDYLLDETADVDFQTPLLAKAFQLARKVAGEGKKPSPEDFLQLPDADLRTLAADLLSRELSISPGWAAKGIESTITGPSVVKQTYWHIMRLKHGVVRQRLDELNIKINATEDADDQIILVKELLEIKQLDSLLSQQLGRVVNA
jgi:DNA primase